MNSSNCRKLGSLLAIGQGLLTMVVPQLTVKVVQKMIGENFENAEELEAKPAYLRQLRAVGIGLAAAGIAGLSMEQAAENTDTESAD